MIINKYCIEYRDLSTRGWWYSTTHSGVEDFAPRVNKSNIRHGNKAIYVLFYTKKNTQKYSRNS